jgi:protoporphyrin/coproporphyrin ferrochelatase
MSPSSLPHVILVNLGTPEEATAPAVRAFLLEFLSDPAVIDFPRWFWQPILRGMVLRTRPQRVAELYSSIWTPEGSPLRVGTERLVAAVSDRGAGRLTASAAYRYGEPSLDTALRDAAARHAGPIVILPLFPHRTDSTTGTAFTRAREAGARAGLSARLVERLVAADDPRYIAALAGRCREAMAAAPAMPDHLVLSYHGIPVRYDRREGHTYTRDCEATTRALLDALDWPADRATLAYQSKFGPERWLTPATADVLASLPGKGVRRVAVITPGFVTDGLETLEEIGAQGRESFLHAGGEVFVRVPGVEAHAAFVDALCESALAPDGAVA